MRHDLERARLAVGLTQGGLAARIGRGQPDISRYESGSTTIPIDLAPKIAEALNLTVLEVLYGPEAGKAFEKSAKAA